MKVTKFSIRNSLGQTARTATFTVNPHDVSEVPFHEIVTVNENDKVSISDLRPNGSLVSVNISHNDVAEHDIFVGQVEFIDDMTTPDIYTATLSLSDLPVKHPHKAKLTMIWNNTRPENTGEDSITAHQILEEACAAAGVSLGRVDLPNYAVVGTFDLVHKDVVQLASTLIGPFNAFEYKQYYVKCDQINGLQIIGVDYSRPEPDGGYSGEAYEIPNISSFERSYEMYMPDNRIGDNDILLTGGDRLIPANDEGGDDEDTGTRTQVTRRTVTEEFFSDSAEFAGQNPPTRSLDDESPAQQSTKADPAPEQRTRTLTRIEFDVEMVNFSTNATTLTEIVEALENSVGFDVDLRISSSRTIYTETWEFEGDTLRQNTQTHNNYTKKVFSGMSEVGNLIYSKKEEIVLDNSQTVTKVYVDSEYPREKSNTIHIFNELGVEVATETKEYTFYPNSSDESTDAGGWYLKGVDVQTQGELDSLNSRIRMFVEMRRALRPNADYDIDGGDSNEFDKMQVVQYQLLNGDEFLPENILNPDKTKGKYVETDIHANYTEEQLRIRNAFALSCPHMTFSGLRLIYQNCLRQLELERANAYWETTNVNSLLDTTPGIGSVVVAAGVTGIVESIDHDIDDDEATTTISVRRLIIPT